jgi:cellulose synthase/poly-beta-1,6-N-acetylglucosamine synthase-like glycosyltransferase
MIVFYFIFFLLMVGYAVLISRYHTAWNAIPGVGRDCSGIEATELSGSTRQSFGTRVSVVISLRNEAHNIGLLLSSLKQQDYPRALTQVILIDDHSTDDTWRLLTDHADPGYIQVLRQSSDNEQPGGSYKKMALAKGIEYASGTLIVTTDADCTAPVTWLSALVDFHEQTQSKFIAAPVRYVSSPGFLSVFERLDFITLQGITGASVSRRIHTMCNGANLAYTKEAFQEVNGFEGIDQIPSGDDMLLMYKIFNRHPQHVAYLKNRAAIVSTAGAGSWRAFFHQRIRWASKAAHYDDKRIFPILLMVYLLNLCFLVAGIAAFWKHSYALFFLLMLIAKNLIEYPFVNSVAMFFGQQHLMRYFPIMQPFHIVYTLIAGWLGKFGSYEWKGRKIITYGKGS